MTTGREPSTLQQRAHLALCLTQVVLVLEDEGERLPHRGRIELAHAERAEAARPVEGLGDARGLAQVEPAEAGDETRHLRGEARVQVGDLQGDDLRLLLRPGEVDEEMQAAPDEGLREVARAVGGEDDDGAVAGADPAWADAARYVKPYVKRNKNDAADAEAICEAVTRPTMRFVEVKTEEQQSVLMLHRTRQLFVRQRTTLINAIRAHLAEFGIVAGIGRNGVERLLR